VHDDERRVLIAGALDDAPIDVVAPRRAVSGRLRDAAVGARQATRRLAGESAASAGVFPQRRRVAVVVGVGARGSSSAVIFSERRRPPTPSASTRRRTRQPLG
jgi:hypothetical protein